VIGFVTSPVTPFKRPKPNPPNPFFDAPFAGSVIIPVSPSEIPLNTLTTPCPNPETTFELFLFLI
jgi:hypothetical protein